RATELRPARAHLRLVGHVGHRAARREVRQDDPLVIAGQDVRALRHEVDAAEDDEVRLAARRGLLGELERVPTEVGPADDLVALVVMAEDDEARSKERLGLADALRELLGRHGAIALRDLELNGGGRRNLVPLARAGPVAGLRGSARRSIVGPGIPRELAA